MLIITASNRPDVLQNNLGKSDILGGNDFVVGMGNQNDFNIPQIYNLATRAQSEAETMFCHDDVFLPDHSMFKINQAISWLDSRNIEWGVLGFAGASMDKFKNSRILTGHIQDRGREWGEEITEPKRVQTLDELCIIINTRHRFLFDDRFPLDFYVADLCMQSHEKGLGVYVIPCYIHHNSSRAIGGRTPSFYESEARFREKWKHRLPIATTCSILK